MSIQSDMTQNKWLNIYHKKKQMAITSAKQQNMAKTNIDNNICKQPK